MALGHAKAQSERLSGKGSARLVLSSVVSSHLRSVSFESDFKAGGPILRDERATISSH